MFRPITFDQQAAKAKNDGGLYRNIYPTDGILQGCGMSVTNTALHIASGLFVLCGRVVCVDGATEIAMENPIRDGYARVKARIDLTKSAGQEETGQFETVVEFSTTELFSALTQEDVNDVGSVYEQELAVLKIEAGNVTGITRKIGNAEIDAEKLGGKLPKYYTDLIAAAQSKADAAVPKTGGNITGALTSSANISTSKNISASGMITSGGDLVAGARVRFANGTKIETDASRMDINAGGASYGVRLLGNAASRCMDAGGGVLQTFIAANLPSSSLRYKKNVGNLTLAEARNVIEMQPVSFTWQESSGWTGKSISYIAEDVEKIDPRFVYYAPYVIREAVTHVDEKTGEIVVDEPAKYGQRVEGLQQNPFIAAYGKLLQDHEKRVTEMETKAAKYDALSSLLVQKGILTQGELDSLEKK